MLPGLLDIVSEPGMAFVVGMRGECFQWLHHLVDVRMLPSCYCSCHLTSGDALDLTLQIFRELYTFDVQGLLNTSWFYLEVLELPAYCYRCARKSFW